MNRNFNKYQKRIILDRDEHRCVYCGKPANGIDHVIPISEGGPTYTCNGVCCCIKCNRSKHTSLDEKWLVTGLAKLIQHGEDISWVASLHEYIISDEMLEAARILLQCHISRSEIISILEIDDGALNKIIRKIGS